jgi:hypothetical protein
VYRQILINGKLQIGTRGQETELTGRSGLRRRRSAMGCRAIEEEEKEEKRRREKKKKEKEK